jgi:hypothetical protein
MNQLLIEQISTLNVSINVEISVVIDTTVNKRMFVAVGYVRALVNGMQIPKVAKKILSKPKNELHSDEEDLGY